MKKFGTFIMIIVCGIIAYLLYTYIGIGTIGIILFIALYLWILSKLLIRDERQGFEKTM